MVIVGPDLTAMLGTLLQRSQAERQRSCYSRSTFARCSANARDDGFATRRAEKSAWISAGPTASRRALARAPLLSSTRHPQSAVGAIPRPAMATWFQAGALSRRNDGRPLRRHAEINARSGSATRSIRYSSMPPRVGCLSGLCDVHRRSLRR